MHFLPRPTPRRAGYSCLPLLLALTAAGCGRPVGDVSGTVTYKGTPVVMGSVVFVGSDGVPHTGQIEPDGTYAVSDVPAGTVKIAVVSPDPGRPLRPGDLPPSLAPLADQEIKGPKAEDARRLQAKMQEVRGIKVDTGSLTSDRKKWRKLPKEYEDPHASGLTMQVTKGKNTYDIPLK
jgi:hypothetical protein